MSDAAAGRCKGKWDKKADPPVAAGAPGYVVTSHGCVVKVATGMYVEGTQPGTPPGDFLPGPSGTTGDSQNVPVPVATSATDAIEHFKTGLGTMLPAALHRASVATASIRPALRGR